MTSGRSGVVTFTTDFGLADSYVSEMKGALLRRLREEAPDFSATLVDVTHLIPRHDIRAASRIVAGLSRAWFPGTVHVVVVDPGVGSARRALALSVSGQVFLGPDNGVFSKILDDAAGIHEIDDSVRLPGDCRVFDGRDLFAPAAALACLRGFSGLPGREASRPLRLPSDHLVRNKSTVEGEIISFDSFGNARTSIPVGLLPAHAVFSVAGLTLSGVRGSYSEVQPGEALITAGSGGFLELALREGDVSAVLGLRIGERIRAAWD